MNIMRLLSLSAAIARRPLPLHRRSLPLSTQAATLLSSWPPARSLPRAHVIAAAAVQRQPTERAESASASSSRAAALEPDAMSVTGVVKEVVYQKGGYCVLRLKRPKGSRPSAMVLCATNGTLSAATVGEELEVSGRMVVHERRALQGGPPTRGERVGEGVWLVRA